MDCVKNTPNALKMHFKKYGLILLLVMTLCIRQQRSRSVVSLSTGSGRHSDAAHEIRLIGCCVLLKVVPKNVPRSGSSQMLSVDWHRSKGCIYFLWGRCGLLSTSVK